MDIYVAGRYKQIDEIKNYYKQLEDLGHLITSKWTEQESIKPFKENKTRAQSYMEDDLRGIRRADTFILIAEYEADSRGCYIELGYALAESEKRYLKIIVVCSDDNPSMFFMNSKIDLVTSFSDALKILK